MFDVKIHGEQGSLYSSTSCHLAWVAGIVREGFQPALLTQMCTGVGYSGAGCQHLKTLFHYKLPLAACQDSFMESEMRFWPQCLTLLGHHSVSHKQQFWHVLLLLYNCDTGSGNNKLPCYYMTTETSLCLVVCTVLKMGTASHCAFTRLESSIFTLFGKQLLNT